MYRALLENNILKEKAEKILGGNFDPVVINRFAMITQNCCLTHPDLAIEHCPFLVQLLHHVKYRSVYDTFANFLSTDQKAKNLQDRLYDVQFFQEYLKVIDSLPNEIPETDVEYISALFKLAPCFQGTEKFKELSESPDAIQVIFHLFEHAPSAVLNSQWSSLSSLINTTNIQDSAIQGFFQRVVNQLTELDNYFYAYQAYAIKVLETYITVDELRLKLVEFEFGTKLNQIINSYPKHTLALNSVISFVLEAIKYQDIRQYFIDSIVPVAGSIIEKSDLVESRAFAWGVFKKLSAHYTEYPGLKELVDNANSTNEESIDKLEEINKVVDAQEQYGGELPQPNNEDDTLSNMTQDQLMALLRFITGGNRR